jgi:CheY-like chemotaxis protein
VDNLSKLINSTYKTCCHLKNIEVFNMKTLKILLAEDDTMIQRLTSFYLRRIGHIVDIAGNGREALSKFRLQHYDVVLMDIQMPEMDGLEAVKEIRKFETSLRDKVKTIIIALTTTSNQQECIDAGMDGYAQKPFKLEDFNKLFGNFRLI